MEPGGKKRHTGPPLPQFLDSYPLLLNGQKDKVFFCSLWEGEWGPQFVTVPLAFVAVQAISVAQPVGNHATCLKQFEMFIGSAASLTRTDSVLSTMGFFTTEEETEAVGN